MRSVSHQMNMAKLPMHRDLASFDFNASSADARLISELASLAFTDTAQNVVLIGGPGTGKTHLATALAVSGITRHGKRVRFYPRSIWSICWSAKNTTAKPGGSPRHCCAWIWSSSTNWVICRSARLAVRCCFTCCPSCTATHQRGDHHQPELRRMVERVRRRQDDHRPAGSADPPLPHRRNR
jgi:hypothetical protein